MSVVCLEKTRLRVLWVAAHTGWRVEVTWMAGDLSVFRTV